MSDMKIIDSRKAAVVTCRGIYEGPKASVSLKFMGVWLKKNNRRKIVAGSISK
jgi:rhodanese-related sulfurtransferase